MKAESDKVRAENLFVGGGEMGALMRSHDWSQTPLGAVETWSESLKTAVQILLTELDRVNPPEKMQPQADLQKKRPSTDALRQAAQVDAFRTRLTNALRPLTDANEIGAIAARILGESLNASRVTYIEVLSGSKQVIVHKNYTNGVAEMSGLYYLEDFGRNLMDDHRAGRSSIVPDVANYSKYTASDKARYRSLDIAAHINVPLIKNEQFVALLAVHQANPRVWTQDEVKQVEETAEQTWAAVERAKAQAALSQSRADLERQVHLFNATLSTITDLVFNFDRDGRVVYANQVLLNLWGVTAENALGKTLAQLNCPQAVERQVMKNVRQVFDTGETVKDETPYTDPAGDNRYFEYILSPVFAAGGTVEYVVGSSRNITDRKIAEQLLRQSEEQSRNILESIAEAFFALDENWQITYVNQAAGTLLDRKPRDLIGKNLWSEYPGLAGSEFERLYWDAMRDRVFGSLTAFYPDHDRWYEVRTYPAATGVTIYFKNVTDQIRAEEALRQSEARFRRIFECKMVPMAVWTTTGGIVEANDALLDLIGYTRQELEAGQVNWQTLTPPEYQQLDERAINDVTTKGFCAAYEKVFVHKDGRPIPILICGASFLDDLNSGVFFAIDLTDRRQDKAALQEQTQLMQLILASIGDGLILANRQGEFVLFNQAAQSIFGRLTNDRSCEEWSRTYGLFLSDQQTLFPEQQFPLYRAMQGEYANDVEVFVRRDSTSLGRWISISGSPVRNRSGEITGGVITCRDISERKRILQQEQAAREEAERANRIKDEFLAVLSHELRSPLNPILGWARLLQTGKLDAARQAIALKTIERNAKLQTQLIEDLLDISRIMQGKLSLTVAPVNLSFVISAAVETVRLAAQAKNIRIALELDFEIAPVAGDAARLQQVIWNLLTNAVKFTPNSGQVSVELRSFDSLAQIRVIDTGKGINPQFLPHVFEYFRQEDSSTTRKFGGLGLGLAIVRQIVEMHGGEVKAESGGENQGATFIVQLPLMQQANQIASEPIHTPIEASVPLEGVQILLVDDEPDTREFQSFVLEQGGANVTAVASGLEALQALDLFTFDVLVSDIGMAQMDGYMLMQLIRDRPANQGGSIRAIALTAYAADIDQQRALQEGFQTHITKPVEPEKLVGAIANLLESN